MEAYRSGHNGPDSKSGEPQGSVGSNPTASAKTRLKWPIIGISDVFLSFLSVFRDATFFTRLMIENCGN